MSSKIIYYPVDNGDQSLISIEEGTETTNILVDCNIRESSKGDEDTSQFDVKADLITQLKTRTVNGISAVPYTDVFILTHGDDDHLHGFEKNFYQGDPKDFKKSNKDNGEIVIDVLWFSPMVMGESTNDDEDCFNAEAKRRIKLHRDDSDDKDVPGNRIVIIGYDANEDLDGLDLVRRLPGDVVNRFNEKDLTTFSIFIHAPYKEQLTESDPDKNHTSVVFQARFKSTASSSDFCALAMFGGDADHYAWEKIVEKTEEHNNHVDEEALTWDLFLAPHHCSWTFFNDTPQTDNPDPVQNSLDVLDYKRGTAKIIASCKEIKNNDDNPPHYKAKEQYVKKVKSENFLNTATHSLKGDTPQPIVFEITTQGPIKAKKDEGSSRIAGAAGLSTVNKPSEYGNGVQ